LRTTPATEFEKSWLNSGKPAALNPNFSNKGTIEGYIKGWNLGFKSAWIGDGSANQATLETWKTVGSSEFKEYCRDLENNPLQSVPEKRKRKDED